MHLSASALHLQGLVESFLIFGFATNKRCTVSSPMVVVPHHLPRGDSSSSSKTGVISSILLLAKMSLATLVLSGKRVTKCMLFALALLKLSAVHSDESPTR